MKAIKPDHAYTPWYIEGHRDGNPGFAPAYKPINYTPIFYVPII